MEFLIRSTSRCELLASSKGSVSFQQNKISIPRISRFENITVVLLVEGKSLEKEDVDTFESKETVGKIVEKKEQINSVAQHVLIWPLSVLIFGLPFGIGSYIGKERNKSVVDYFKESIEPIRQTPESLVTEYRVEQSDLKGISETKLFKTAKAGVIQAKIAKVSQRGDEYKIEFLFSNKHSELVEFDVTGKAPGIGGIEGFSERHISDFVVLPNSEKTSSIKLKLTERVIPKVAIVDVRISSLTMVVWYQMHIKFP